MTTDRIKLTVEAIENDIGYLFVYKDKCQGCRSLDYRFYTEPKIIIKASFCKLFSYNREILKNCPCTQCIVKLMCNEKDKCHVLKDFLREVLDELEHRQKNVNR